MSVVEKKDYLKKEILEFLGRQLKGAVFTVEDVRKMLKKKGYNVDFYLMQEIIEELYFEGKIVLYVKVA